MSANHYYARCLCGLRLALHRDAHNRTLRCAEAMARHPRATRRSHRSLGALLRASTVYLARERMAARS